LISKQVKSDSDRIATLGHAMKSRDRTIGSNELIGRNRGGRYVFLQEVQWIFDCPPKPEFHFIFCEACYRRASCFCIVARGRHDARTVPAHCRNALNKAWQRLSEPANADFQRQTRAIKRRT
jgi:hypothetical protein